MKTQKLIPLLDYVLENTYDKIDYGYNRNEVKVHNYAKFLSQPLKLSQFVPCYIDSDGNERYFEEPTHVFATDNRFEEEKRNYEKAKSNILFEGFFDNGTGCAIFQQNPNAMVIDKSIEGKRLEILLDSKCILTLTENAVKLINE